MARERNYIGSYRLLKIVRAGATCQIWEVIDEADNKRCALKALQDDFHSDREQIALLKHEYTVGHELHDSTIIEIYDFNIAKGVPYLALEFFNALNLKQRIRQQREGGTNALPYDQELMIGVVQQCAKSLGILHQHGWVHCDVKPDNFLANDEGVVKLIDFAIADKIKKKKGFARFFSGKGKIQGTRSYMSPEQIRGEPLDERSDVYSLGCTLFEMHCGRPPFTGGNADQLLQKHLKAPAPSLAANCEFATSEFNNLLANMMAKKPEQRPADMNQFSEQLDSIRVYRRQ